jgi:hypothetical protein
MKDFIFLSDQAINPAFISHITYKSDGSVVLEVGNDVVTCDGDDAKVFIDARPKPAPEAKHEHDAEAKPVKSLR